MNILISEVGPRDGLQSIAPVMPIEAKKAWIAAEAAAGVTEIEVGSFVPAKLLPQLADTAEVVRYARSIPGLTVAALVPNLRGAEAAVEVGAHKITLPLSVSETHSLKNVRRTHAQMLDEARAIVALLRGLPADRRPKFEGGLSTAFGCTLEGPVPPERVVALAEALMGAGCDEVGLADTSGYANPAQVRDLVRRVHAAVGSHAAPYFDAHGFLHERFVGARGSHVGQMLFFAYVHVQIFVPAVFADDHAAIDLHAGADEHDAAFLGHEDSVAGAGAVFVRDQRAVRRDEQITFFGRLVGGKHVVHDDRAAGFGQKQILEAHDAARRNVVFEMHFVGADVGMNQAHMAQLDRKSTR